MLDWRHLASAVEDLSAPAGAHILAAGSTCRARAECCELEQRQKRMLVDNKIWTL